MLDLGRAGDRIDPSQTRLRVTGGVSHPSVPGNQYASQSYARERSGPGRAELGQNALLPSNLLSRGEKSGNFLPWEPGAVTLKGRNARDGSQAGAHESRGTSGHAALPSRCPLAPCPEWGSTPAAEAALMEGLQAADPVPGRSLMGHRGHQGWTTLAGLMGPVRGQLWALQAARLCPLRTVRGCTLPDSLTGCDSEDELEPPSTSRKWTGP